MVTLTLQPQRKRHSPPIPIVQLRHNTLIMQMVKELNPMDMFLTKLVLCHLQICLSKAVLPPGIRIQGASRNCVHL